MAYLPNKEFKELSQKIHKSLDSVELTPKELLAYFGVTTRRTNVMWWVDRALKENDLQTIPSYKSGWIHAKIELTTEKIINKKKQEKEIDTIIPRVKLLEAANTKPTYITKSDTIEKAMTIMMENDYSQLPVMNSQSAKQVDGMISWHSIGWKKALGKNQKTVSDFMNKGCTIINDTCPLLDAVEIVQKNEVVLIRDKSQSICGLVTITDIAEKFYALAEPFFIIGQIEAAIREILDDKFSVEELQKVKYGEDNREIQTISDLTFSEYIQLMRQDENWQKLKLPLDKDELTKRLDNIRLIRNDVMHFNTDNIDDEQKYMLRKTALFLREILN
ncbi:CBS domain-containing protein [Pleomorphovibrio marinus]|uniref:CBS domain-containing protein n=1 Tax=Pleomorphovibrio marinus TaxID=2164132 RepID=UPI000E0AC85C|nr:CBS domain-containing protein [Pleomorphovibrio marinus]